MASPAGRPNATDSKTVTDTIVGKLVFVAHAVRNIDIRLCTQEDFLLGLMLAVLCVHPAGEHTHTIVGYSLIKGIGDGEPIASERFTVGGHEWVSTDGRALLCVYVVCATLVSSCI
jgi:hypothetical protein